MSFYETLIKATEAEKNNLFTLDVIQASLHGDISLDLYVAFLQQAFHHVKHTVPLLMRCGSRLTESQEWLRVAIAEYIEEESGHQEWVLNDIAACGYNKEQARVSVPNFATEMMVSYAYDSIDRVSPLAFFGMVLVLEGTSTQLATKAAGVIQASLNLPNSAFSYLTSHGELDLEHVKFYEGLMNQITDPAEQAVIIHAAKNFYKLYANVFSELAESQAQVLKQ
ncbi:TenA family transcriptional regulator [Sessilibacter sp. MAH4]